MRILCKIVDFSAPLNDLVIIYIMYVRSILEQSCPLWHSSLTQEDSDNLERVQKCAAKTILQENYTTYEESLEFLMLAKLSSRREKLCLRFALNCSENPLTKELFPLNQKSHMETRKSEKYQVFHANTERLRNSTVPYLQRLLNTL